NAASVGGQPVMLVDRQGNLNVAWTALEVGSNFDVEITGSIDGGVTFNSPLNVSANVGVSIAPLLSVQADGNLGMLWSDDSAENQEVFSAVLAPLPPATPDFALISQFLSVPRGFEGNLVLNVSRPGAFTGSVSVTAPSTLPQGITISPSQVSTATTNAKF